MLTQVIKFTLNIFQFSLVKVIGNMANIRENKATFYHEKSFQSNSFKFNQVLGNYSKIATSLYLLNSIFSIKTYL